MHCRIAASRQVRWQSNPDRFQPRRSFQ
jgi:hypothetical protein